jgi:hypothetical protein
MKRAKGLVESSTLLIRCQVEALSEDLAVLSQWLLQPFDILDLRSQKIDTYSCGYLKYAAVFR